jgi:hypothetical protein
MASPSQLCSHVLPPLLLLLGGSSRARATNCVYNDTYSDAGKPGCCLPGTDLSRTCAVSFTGTCPAGTKKRGHCDGHMPSSGPSQSECCQKLCSTYSGCPAGKTNMGTIHTDMICHDESQCDMNCCQKTCPSRLVLPVLHWRPLRPPYSLPLPLLARADGHRPTAFVRACMRRRGSADSPLSGCFCGRSSTYLTCPAGFARSNSTNSCRDQNAGCTASECCLNFCHTNVTLKPGGSSACSALPATATQGMTHKSAMGEHTYFGAVHNYNQGSRFQGGCGDTDGDGQGDGCTTANCCGITCSHWSSAGGSCSGDMVVDNNPSQTMCTSECGRAHLCVVAAAARRRWRRRTRAVALKSDGPIIRSCVRACVLQIAQPQIANRPAASSRRARTGRRIQAPAATQDGRRTIVQVCSAVRSTCVPVPAADSAVATTTPAAAAAAAAAALTHTMYV